METAQDQLNDSINQINNLLQAPEKMVKITSHQIGQPSTMSAKPVSGVSYVEGDHIIARTDGKEISDEEIAYLMQVGYEKQCRQRKNFKSKNL